MVPTARGAAGRRRFLVAAGAVVAVSVTLLLWASAFVAIRHLADTLSPGALSLGRLLVGSLCLGVAALSRGLPRLTRRDWLPLIVIISLGLMRPLKGVMLAAQFMNKASEARHDD